VCRQRRRPPPRQGARRAPFSARVPLFPRKSATGGTPVNIRKIRPRKGFGRPQRKSATSPPTALPGAQFRNRGASGPAPVNGPLGLTCTRQLHQPRGSDGGRFLIPLIQLAPGASVGGWSVKWAQASTATRTLPTGRRSCGTRSRLSRIVSGSPREVRRLHSCPAVLHKVKTPGRGLDEGNRADARSFAPIRSTLNPFGAIIFSSAPVVFSRWCLSLALLLRQPHRLQTIPRTLPLGAP
jgi:hypothetical protein